MMMIKQFRSVIPKELQSKCILNTNHYFHPHIIQRMYISQSKQFPKLQALLHDCIEQSSLISAVLHNPIHNKDNKLLTKVSIRPIKLKNELRYQVTKIVNRQAFDENVIPGPQFEKQVLELIAQFKQCVLHTDDADYHLLLSSNSGNVNNELSISKRKPTRKSLNSTLDHNRKKKYILEDGHPVPFLVHLGVMSKDGKVLAKKYDKFRQINRFLEMVEEIIPVLNKKQNKNTIESIESDDNHIPIRIVDFGCGKAYLTFALYHYLVHVLKWSHVTIIGLDLKREVIEECNRIAKQVGYSEGLQFQMGDISHFEPNSSFIKSTTNPKEEEENEKEGIPLVNMVVTLHACNTATDKALEKAITWNSELILSVPCCHHELYTQIESEPLKPLLQHGILKERFSSLATDALRAQILEILGYRTQILEFIDMEHTPKNILIRACKTTSTSTAVDPNTRKRVLEYLKMRDALSAEPFLEKLLLKDKLQSIFDSVKEVTDH